MKVIKLQQPETHKRPSWAKKDNFWALLTSKEPWKFELDNNKQ